MNYQSPPPTYGAPYYQPQPQKKSGVWAAVGIGCFLLFVICIVLAAFGWSRFVQFGVGTDLADYRSAIEQSNLAAAQKTVLTSRIDRLRAKVSAGSVPSFLSWLPHDEVLDDMTKDRIITPEEFAALNAELDRIERELR
jgi:hypothetical protein